MNNNYDNGNIVLRHKFFQIPMSLVLEPKYKNLKNDAIMLYAILDNRRSLSYKNNWRDEEGKYYFYFKQTNTKEEEEIDEEEKVKGLALDEILKCSTKKVRELLKDLEKHDLLIRKAQGQGRPDRLYLLDVEVTNPALCYSYDEENKSILGIEQDIKNNRNNIKKETVKKERQENKTVKKVNKVAEKETDTDIGIDIDFKEIEKANEMTEVHKAAVDKFGSVTVNEKRSMQEDVKIYGKEKIIKAIEENKEAYSYTYISRGLRMNKGNKAISNKNNDVKATPVTRFSEGVASTWDDALIKVLEDKYMI